MINIQAFWRRRGILNILLLPAAAVFAAAAAGRRRMLLRRPAPALPPVIIVGSIVAGGSGKTPVVINLAEQLAARGRRPGIVSRGYGGAHRGAPLLVQPDTDWRQCGDEPLLIRRRTGLPVCVGPRAAAAERLAAAGCDVIISDDGLQHYALPRAVEIGVISARYRLGNGWRLPAGPLREPPARLRRCDLRLLVGGDSEGDLIGAPRISRGLYALAAPQTLLPPDFFAGKTVTALAGIAHPQLFFDALQKQGITLHRQKPLADHAAADLSGIRSDIILMTEKDAVKYPAADPRLHAMAIDCLLPPQVIAAILEKLAASPANQPARRA